MNGPPSVDDMRMYGGAPVGQTRARRDAGRLVGIAVFVVVLVLAGGAVFVGSGSSHSWFPSKWDARVAPIAAEVAKLRGLEFVHPVPINYLTPKEFEKELGGGGAPSASDRAEIAREEAVFRALGFIGGKVDLLREFGTQRSSGTLAYYDPDREQIIVRGTTLDVEHRVTIAHEMTHVLQDQHFDLPKLQKRAADSESGDASALKALVEGDAVRIENDYLAQVSTAEQKEYNRENKAEGARVGKATASVPAIVGIISDAPYEFGESTVRVLLESGGNSAIDGALTGATPSTEVFIEAGDITPPVVVDTPVLPAGASRVGSPETFGPFETFLTLSMRLDPARALGKGGEAEVFEVAPGRAVKIFKAPDHPDLVGQPAEIAAVPTSSPRCSPGRRAARVRPSTRSAIRSASPRVIRERAHPTRPRHA